LVEESAVALVEWGEMASSVFGRDVMNVDFLLDEDEGRTLEVSGALTNERTASLDEWASR
jgi:tRNA A37 threonylcarbamoyladenosine biosynthesis protein TsaE